jgi:hypothetical protein
MRFAFPESPRRDAPVKVKPGMLPPASWLVALRFSL